MVVSGGCFVLQSLKLTPHMYAYISNPSCSPWTLGVQWWVQCSSCSGATLVGVGRGEYVTGLSRTCCYDEIWDCYLLYHEVA